MTKQDLIDFEDDIAGLFNAGKIRHPIHLESGNEDQLLEVFEDINPKDWVFTSWRGHLKALLHGVPPEELRAAIFRGESMTLSFPEHRVYGSAIVGGTIPIALGVAEAIQLGGCVGALIGRSSIMVHCFLGDMTAETGIFHECQKYARNHDLPIRFIIEDNGLSVCTNTERVWGGKTKWDDVVVYKYHSKWPHCGAGERVQF